MFDIGWSELLVIGIVALIVVGPKDLPVMFRALGQFTAKARAMARDFQRAIEDAAEDAGAKDVADNLKTLSSARNFGLDEVKSSVASKFDNWDATKRGLREGDKDGAEGATEAAGAEHGAEHGPATTELAARRKSETEAAEARAADLRLQALAREAGPAAADASGVATPARKPRRRKTAAIDGASDGVTAALPAGEKPVRGGKSTGAKNTGGKSAAGTKSASAATSGRGKAATSRSAKAATNAEAAGSTVAAPTAARKSGKAAAKSSKSAVVEVEAAGDSMGSATKTAASSTAARKTAARKTTVRKTAAVTGVGEDAAAGADEGAARGQRANGAASPTQPRKAKAATRARPRRTAQNDTAQNDSAQNGTAPAATPQTQSDSPKSDA